MKLIVKILAFIMLVSITSAEIVEEEKKEEKKEREYKIVVGFSPYTKHAKAKHLNEGPFDNNNLVQVGVSKNNVTISYTYFENSFFTESHAVMIEKKKYLKESNFFYKYGVGIVKGYEYDKPFIDKAGNNMIEKSYLNFYKDYSFLGTVGAGYSYKQVDFTIDFFGECLVTGIRYEF